MTPAGPAAPSVPDVLITGDRTAQMTAPPARYEIRAEGVLGEDWSAGFDGLQAASDGTGTVISGVVPDQPALHGPLNPGPRSWPLPDLGAPDQMTSPNAAHAVLSSPQSMRS